MANEKMTASIGAKITDFTRKMKRVKASLASLPRSVGVKIKVKTTDAYRRLNSIATAIRSIGEVSQSMISGALISSFSAAIPVIASATAAVGALGASFAAAGTGAAAFGIIATSALNDVFGANKDINKLQEKLKKTDDEKKRAEIKKKIAKATRGLSKAQKEGLKSLQSFSSFWAKFSKQFQKPVVDIFTRSLGTLKGVIKSLKPVFEGSLGAMSTLLKSLNKSLKSADVQVFFDWLGKSAGPAMTAFGKAFGNVIRGIMNLMVAFGPLSEDMQGGLVDLSERFLKWTQNVGKSKGFKKFIDYIRTNGPKILQLIGSLVDLIVNLGTSMAPLGSQVLNIVTGFVKWLNALIKANPTIGKVIGYIITIIGVLKLVSPPILLLQSLFGGMAKAIWRATGMMRARVLTSMKMIGKSMLNGAKSAGKAAGRMIAAMARIIAKYAWMAARALFNAARMAASWFIALGPIGWVIAAVIGLAILIIANWDKIKKWTVKIFKAVWGFLKDVWHKTVSFITDTAKDIWHGIKSAWDSVMDFLKGIDLFGMGKDIIQGLVNGVKHMAGALIDGVKKVVGGAVDWAKDFLGIGSPSKLMKQIGEWTGEGMAIGIDKSLKKVNQSSLRLAHAAVPNMSGSVGPSLNSVGSSNNVTVNNKGLLDGAVFHVREDADIRRLAIELGEYIEDGVRR
ncbi:MAG TPA: hypothetical protein VFG39_09410 [Balneolaceae bacterium]|nr:hypothetical protein [Balneolaceae bacterium]